MGNREATKTDFSSFMCIILMLTGALVTIMIANVVIISANPDNIQITSIMPETSIGDGGGAGEADIKDAFGNTMKSPWYIDVWRDHLVIYPDPPSGSGHIEIHDLEEKDNPFEAFLNHVEPRRETEYVVLIVRPWASSVARQLKKAIVDRGLDIGMDLMDGTTPIKLRNVAEENKEAKAAAGRAK
jgi:hypothetical protein